MPLKANILWRNQLKDKDGAPLRVYDVAFNPDGSHLVVAAGNSVQVFDAKDGRMINKLNAHKNTVHGVTYSRDGAFFASGSADKTVIIWTRELEGQLKYSHADGVQCLSYNPVSHQILSCAISDIGLWSPEHRNVAKRKVTCRVCSCSWTNDGQYFALGLFNGVVSIWTKNGDEKIKIERPGNYPVWCLAWNPSRYSIGNMTMATIVYRDDQYDVLSVCDWGQKLSFYQLSGKQIGKDHPLDFDPCFFSYSIDGDFFFIGGSNKITSFYSKEGVKLGTLGEPQNSWIWSCQSRPGGKEIVITCDDGTILCYNVSLVTVHGLYKDRYAYRHGLTDVVVQHLLTEEKVHLRCRDMVKKIAVYKNRLAVQLPEKLIVYELSTDAKSGDMTYFVKEKITRSLQCSLLVCCSEHIVFCSDKKLLSLTMKGEIEREWVVDSQIRYLKVLGGASGREAMLAGLKNGLILKFFLNNPFPVEVYKIPGIVRCVDINNNHSKLAVVDESNLLVVYDVTKKELIYQEPNATSVAWNTSYDDMLCYSGNGILYVKAGNFAAHQQQLQTGQGFVVGFIGSKIFSLHYFNMTTTEISQSAPMKQYLEQKMYSDAYKVACLGVSQDDWHTLALEALEGMNFEIAKKSFARIHNIKFLDLIHQMEDKGSKGEGTESFLGDVLANEGKFMNAAKEYCKNNRNDKAVEMYTDLCQFELAKQFMSQPDKTEQKAVVRELKVKEADWAKTKNDPSKACDMYLSAGEYIKAVTLMADNGWTHKLIAFSNETPISQREALILCAHHLRRLGEYNFAADVYEKLEDYFSLIALYAETHQWEKGFDLVEGKADLKDLLYLPYTTFLMENDRFEEAQEALSKAEKQNEAVSLLAQLTSSALSMKKFKDASYYHWLQARAYLQESKQLPKGSEAMRECIDMFHWHVKSSEIYYVYQHIHSFINLPFTGQLPETMFQMACFLANHLTKNAVPGISKVSTYLTLGKHGTTVGAYKTARRAYDKLQSFLVPSDLQDFIETALLTLKGKSLQDSEDVLRFCYRCSTSNPPVNPNGDFCITCHQPFVYSFASFEVLPLIEFFLEDDINDEEALELIKAEPKTDSTADVDVLKLNNSTEDNDPFVQKLMMMDENGDYPVVTVDRHILASLHWTSVIVKKWPFPLKYQYYCSQIPNVPIRLCSSCNQMFYSEDYELHVLCNGQCPFCREPKFPKT